RSRRPRGRRPSADASVRAPRDRAGRTRGRSAARHRRAAPTPASAARNRTRALQTGRAREGRSAAGARIADGTWRHGFHEGGTTPRNTRRVRPPPIGVTAEPEQREQYASFVRRFHARRDGPPAERLVELLGLRAAASRGRPPVRLHGADAPVALGEP